MSLQPESQAPTIERLGPRDVPDAATFLDVDPVLHVYLVALLLRDALGRPRDEWWAARRAGRITALLYLGGNSGAVLPAGDDLDALRALATGAVARIAALPPRFQIIGPRANVAAVRERFPGPGPALRLERQRLGVPFPAGPVVYPPGAAAPGPPGYRLLLGRVLPRLPGEYAGVH